MCRKVAGQCICPAQCSLSKLHSSWSGTVASGACISRANREPKHGCCSITWSLLVFYMYFHWWTFILSSQRQEQVGAVAAVLTCVVRHISILTSGICVFCVCWAHISSLAATWIWGHGATASPLLGCCIQTMSFPLAWSSWAC